MLCACYLLDAAPGEDPSVGGGDDGGDVEGGPSLEDWQRRIVDGDRSLGEVQQVQQDQPTGGSRRRFRHWYSFWILLHTKNK